MGVRNIKKQLAGVEDLLLGNGTQTQERNSGSVTITKIDVPAVVDDYDALRLVDTTKYRTAIVRDEGIGGTFNLVIGSTEDNGGTIISALPSSLGGGRWERQYSGPVNVKWFGAKGDGVTDDTTAIQNAIDNHLYVYIPEGYYRVSDLMFGDDGAILSGSGPQVTILMAHLGTEDSLLTIEEGRQVSIRDIGFQGTVTKGHLLLGTRGTEGTGVGASFPQMLRLYNLYFHGSVGIYMYGSNTGTFDSLFFESCTTGLLLQPVGTGNCNANEFINIHFYSCVTAFSFNNCLDAGAAPTENTLSGGIEATTGSTLFTNNGTRNIFNLWLDTNTPHTATFGNYNIYNIKDAMGLDTSSLYANNIVNIANGAIAVNSSMFTVSPTIALLTYSSSGQIQSGLVRGQSKEAVVKVQNTSGGTIGLTLNMFSDVPINFKLTIIHVANTAGFLLKVPSSGTWTTEGWANNDNFGAYSQWSSITLIKTGEYTITRIKHS